MSSSVVYNEWYDPRMRITEKAIADFDSQSFLEDYSGDLLWACYALMRRLQLQRDPWWSKKALLRYFQLYRRTQEVLLDNPLKIKSGYDLVIPKGLMTEVTIESNSVTSYGWLVSRRHATNLLMQEWVTLSRKNQNLHGNNKRLRSRNNKISNQILTELKTLDHLEEKMPSRIKGT